MELPLNCTDVDHPWKWEEARFGDRVLLGHCRTMMFIDVYIIFGLTSTRYPEP